MFKNARDEINILLNTLERMGNLSCREIKIGVLCYNVGKIIKEQEIIENRNLFEEFDEDEKPRNKIKQRGMK